MLSITEGIFNPCLPNGIESQSTLPASLPSTEETSTTETVLFIWTLVSEFPIDVSQHYVYLWVKAEEMRGGTKGRLHRSAPCSSLRPQQNTPEELSLEMA